ncbi:MAG: alcohol dehydrogenase catalytic domain-containing protein [Candidatus Binatia bacterium]
MRGHVLVRPGHVELRELPRPRAGRDGVVVRVRAALTCGTDVKTFVRGHPIFPTPTLFGHEFAGEVAEVGSEVRGVREGDPVMAAPTAPCGDCYYCVREQENLCAQVTEQFVVGAFAEYVRLPGAVVRANLYQKPPALPYAEAALLEPLACVLHGLSHARVRGDDTVVLVGAGAIALLHLLVLRHRGVERIVVLARSAGRAAQATALGAEVLREPVAAAQEAIAALTEGRGADVVIECTGQPSIWEAAPALARRGGQVVLFGGCPVGTAVRFDTARLHYEQVAIASPFHFTPATSGRPTTCSAAGASAAARWSAESCPSSGSKKRWRGTAAAKARSTPFARLRHESRPPLRLPRRPHRGRADPGDRSWRGAGARPRVRRLLGRRGALVHPQEGAARLRTRAGGRDRRGGGRSDGVSARRPRLRAPSRAVLSLPRLRPRRVRPVPDLEAVASRSRRHGRVLPRSRRQPGR